MKQNPPSDFPYRWCSASGNDAFGIWLEFRIGKVVQRMRWISPGTFTMGSPFDEPHRHYSESRHDVTLTKGFWIADTTCTQSMWWTVMGKESGKNKNQENPVENISRNDCDLFLKKMTSFISDISFSLPTEAQWEFACRGGTTDPFSFGITVSPEQVNYNGEYPYLGEEKGLNRGGTVIVKSLPPNPWGLYEMHGNIWEWCNDWYGEYETGNVIDPCGPAEGTYRVLRGGSAFSGAADCRSAARSRCHSEGRYRRNGFRFVWNPPDLNPKEKNVMKEQSDLPDDTMDTEKTDDFSLLPANEEVPVQNRIPPTNPINNINGKAHS